MKKNVIFFCIAIIAFAVPALAMECPVLEGRDAVFYNVTELDLEMGGFVKELDAYGVSRWNQWLNPLNVVKTSETLISRSKVTITEDGKGTYTLRVPYVGLEPFDMVQFPEGLDKAETTRNWFMKENLFHLYNIPNQGIEKSPCIVKGPLFQVPKNTEKTDTDSDK